MKKNKKLPTGKHIINLYIDWDSEDAGCFIQGDYDSLKTLLFNAAVEDDLFEEAFLDAALEYANWLNEQQKGGKR